MKKIINKKTWFAPKFSKGDKVFVTTTGNDIVGVIIRDWCSEGFGDTDFIYTLDLPQSFVERLNGMGMRSFYRMREADIFESRQELKESLLKQAEVEYKKKLSSIEGMWGT